ncbi:MAG: hypothetical protein K2P51_01580 [Rhabdochlamydiaceae bacterium]|nr:hypothetical protein [Rhabdochlamydiaceae bacterium]
MTTDQEISGESEEQHSEQVQLPESEQVRTEEVDSSLPKVEETEQEVDIEKEKKGSTPQFVQFFSQFEQLLNPEEKIRLSIDFMRTALSNAGTPRFRDFWEGRRLCLPLFKENLTPKSRSLLWGEYVELSSEARRLKEILDEQSLFAIEQIELAIQALERELENYDLHLSLVSSIAFPEALETFKAKRSVYELMQKELHLLNTLAARINGLRKEILKTEMRIRTKNKLFDRLSKCGDRVFPRRKDLIKSISQQFTEDVAHFVQSHFQEGEVQKLPLYALREEIKGLQALAKVLTLNTQSFTQTRQLLSSCWDKIRMQEKERKKEFAQKRQAFKQNFDAVIEKIQALTVLCETDVAIEDANRASQEIFDFMKGLDLGRDEVKSLSNAIHRAKRPILDRARAIEQEREQKEREVELKKREKILAIKAHLQSLIAAVDEQDPDHLNAQREELAQEYAALAISKAEKQIFDRLFKQLKDLINEKKERALMALSEDDLNSLSQLKVMLDERKERRQEIKTQLESYRKALGGSGFDFEKAMMYREMIEAEKHTLDKINASIDEIEDKIFEIGG